MRDPILDAHEVLRGFYLISGGLSPISIRDQMLRGQLVVERLAENRLINGDTQLLVVGAGVGGVTAAICAARKGVRTILVEKTLAPFGVQRRGATRFLNPTQYDWPVDHWPYGVFPWLNSHVQLPLPYPTDWAGILVALWEKELRKAEHDLRPLLTYFDETAPAEIDPDLLPGQLTVRFSGGWTATDTFEAIIWAAGSGEEECRLFAHPQIPQPNPIYEGRSFWSTDPLTATNLGVLGHAPRVLISGSGDGGLQDYLRVVTRYDSAEQLYRMCNIPQEIADRIQSAEDRAHRGRAWAREDKNFRKIHEQPFLQELHQEHQEAIEDALSVTDVYQSLEQLFPVAPPYVVLVYREPYFTNYYGLNRFLVLLVDHFLRKKFGQATLRPETMIIDVSTKNTDGHVCMVQVGGEWQPAGGYRAPTCHGRNHEVFLQDTQGISSDQFNVIIVRHGLLHNTVPLPPLPQEALEKLPLVHSRQLLPYHLPA